jgi:hypothetical protein
MAARLENASINHRRTLMKEETALELLKLSTQLACATINQNRYSTDTRTTSVGGVLEDCLKMVQAHFHDMTKSS